MTPDKIEYDSDASVLWIHWPKADGDTLLARDEIGPFAAALMQGRHDGRPIAAVHFVFYDEGAAAYNRDSLSFARIATFLAGDPPRRYRQGEEPAFEVREDGGMPPTTD